jgi:hypothetical protein
MKKYTIHLNKNQLRVIQMALNATFRFKMGQFGDMLNELTDINGEIFKGNDFIFNNKVEKEIEGILKPLMGLEHNETMGVGRFSSIDQMVAMHDCIRYELHINDADRLNCWCPKPIDFSGGIGMIKVELVDEDE